MEKGQRLTIRISDDEMEALKQKAQESGMSVSELFRAAAVSGFSRIYYGQELCDYARSAYEDIKRIAEEIREYKLKHDGDITGMIISLFEESQLREIYKKLSYMADIIDELELEVPSYDDAFPDEFWDSIVEKYSGGHINE